MSDLENFTLSESSEGVDSGAFERLKEKMAQARGQIAKDKKQEGKQKKQEDKLFNVIQELLKHLPPSHPLIKNIVACLSASIPSQLLLVTISLNYKSLHKTVDLDSVEILSQTKTLIPASIQNIEVLLRWVSLVKLTIQSSKESDLKNIFINNNFTPPYNNLLSFVVKNFFSKKINIDLSSDQKNEYTQKIIQEINSPINPMLEPKPTQSPQAS